MRTSGFADRTVHLVDLENMVGSGHLTEAAVSSVRAAYLATGLVVPGDHVIVGISHHNLLAAGYGWPGSGLRVRSGPDGADLALQETMATEQLAVRFGAAILVTGDGGFAHPVAALIGLGLPVGVIAPKGRLSAALRLAASVAQEVDFNPDTNTSWSA